MTGDISRGGEKHCKEEPRKQRRLAEMDAPRWQRAHSAVDAYASTRCAALHARPRRPRYIIMRPPRFTGRRSATAVFAIADYIFIHEAFTVSHVAFVLLCQLAQLPPPRLPFLQDIGEGNAAIAGGVAQRQIAKRECLFEDEDEAGGRASHCFVVYLPPPPLLEGHMLLARSSCRHPSARHAVRGRWCHRQVRNNE